MSADTIAAISTASGPAGISIVRISGREAITVADSVFQSTSGPLAGRPGGTFVFGMALSQEGEPLDEVIALVFRAPRSFTREDVVEIQGHGGVAGSRALLASVLSHGARMAEPGEFTRRAFLNGRLDLIQAEAVLEVIHAQTDMSHRIAFEHLAGRASGHMHGWYDSLIEVAGNLEACLDFEQGEIPSPVLQKLFGEIRRVGHQIEAMLGTWHKGRVIKEGLRVVIAGQPNAGKSTLLNRLLGSERAIVSDVPGTTRDFIEDAVVFNGILLRLVDTAGIRETNCSVEQEGIRRAQIKATEADILIYMADGSKSPTPPDLEMLAASSPERTLLVLNKEDLGLKLADWPTDRYRFAQASLIRADGDAHFRKELGCLVEAGYCDAGSESMILTEARHRELLERAVQCINAALAQAAEGPEANLVAMASELREVLEALGQLTGRIYTNELLERVFSRFCIGK